MIPVLYDKSERDFSHNGIGFLTDIVSATVTEERNGVFELTFKYPITGRLYEKIIRGSTVKAKANETSELQIFRIYKVSKPLGGIVTYNAEHISYDLCGVPLVGFKAENTTPIVAMDTAFSSAVLPCDFKAWSDISTINSTVVSEPCSVRSILGGRRGSVLDVWGGEYEFDNFTVKLHQHRGRDNGVTIEYGKNLIDLKQEENIADCYTHLLPYTVCRNEEENKDEYFYLSNTLIPLTECENNGRDKVLIKDFSDRFSEGETITEESLKAEAETYAKASRLGVPKINITVSFVNLWQTEEYKNIAFLERVRLCDTVTVRFAKLGVEAASKVIKTVYDVLKEKYESLTLGEAKSNLADAFNEQKEEITHIKDKVETSPTVEEIKNAIKDATNSITGQSGGYVVLNPPENPQEILILDEPDINKAVNVWRWNSGGLGHSSTGYNGEYSTAITANGRIVADFITAGKLNAAVINGRLQSRNGESFFDLDNGLAQLTGSFTAKASSDNPDLGTSVTLKGFKGNFNDPEAEVENFDFAGLVFENAQNKKFSELMGFSLGGLNYGSWTLYNDKGEEAASLSMNGSGGAGCTDEFGWGRIFSTANLLIESGITEVTASTPQGGMYIGETVVRPSKSFNWNSTVLVAPVAQRTDKIKASCTHVEADGTFRACIARTDPGFLEVFWAVIDTKV